MDLAGDRLVVKLYGRDAADTQRLTTLWRTVWYREPGAPVPVHHLQQVEHEAFLTLLARQAGVLTHDVVTAGATAQGDVALVLRASDGRPPAPPQRWRHDTAQRLWDVLGLLHDTGIVHGRIDDRHLIVDGERVGLTDFDGAALSPAEAGRRSDQAQALVTTVLVVGEQQALAAAVSALGADALAGVLPFLQVTALTSWQRGAVRRAGLDLDALRTRAAALVEVEAPQLQRLRRVTWGTVVQVALLVVAFLALAWGLAGIDLPGLVAQLGAAVWWLVALGVVAAQLTRLAQALASLGAAPVPVPLGPVYALQLATAYISLAVPTSAARIAVNIRFFQRRGLPAGSALMVGAVDAVSGFLVQMGLLAGILLLTPVSLDLDLGASVPAGLERLLVVVVLAAAVGLAVLLLVARWRLAVLTWVRQLLSEALGALRGVSSPRRAGLLLGGHLAAELLLASALGAFARSLGYAVGLDELLVIGVSVSLLAGLLPVPGGVGVVEGGLTYGLVRAGVPEEVAFAAVLMYRLATFYLPPIWGFFALRWLERNAHL